MLVVFPFHSGDLSMLENLLVWIRQISNCREHDALLVADAGVDYEAVLRMRQLALDSFGKAEVISNVLPVTGWPQGPNSLFLEAVKWCGKNVKNGNYVGWLWLEPDAVPLHHEWLGLIEMEHRAGGKRYSGHVYTSKQAGLPGVFLSGVAVYPMDAAVDLLPFLQANPMQAFDVAMVHKVIPLAAHNNRIQHLWGEDKFPPTFVRSMIPAPRRGSHVLAHLAGNAVLFHRNKDGTLIELLRERHGMKLAAPLPEPAARGVIRVRRTASLGDVLSATCVARKLWDLGYDVEFQAHPSTHCILRRVPEVKTVGEPGGTAEVDLDGCYELDSGRKHKHFAEMFLETANRQLGGRWIEKLTNYAPTMKLLPGDLQAAEEVMGRYPKPWVLICPRSQSWANRTIPDETWFKAAVEFKGTAFWLGLGPIGPIGHIVDLGCRHFDRAIGFLAAANLLVTVDTGPMHVAAALGTPVVAIQQASSPELHLSDQVDFTMISPQLSCLNCQMNICPIHAERPPCQTIHPVVIADAVNARLRSVLTDDVSVVIVIHKPKAERLNRCLEAVMNQVQEIVVVFDGASTVPQGALRGRKIRYVRARGTDLGYGRKANAGARATNGKYIWFLNDDCYVNPDCGAKLLDVIRSDARVGVVGHLLRWLDGTIQHGGTFRERNGMGFGHLDLHQRSSRFTKPVEMENVTGASILVRRRAYFEVHGHDEDYFLYCEDNQLCMDLRAEGWKVMFTPLAEATHEEHQSTNLRQGMHTIMQQSCATFGRKNKWYFELNRGYDGLGRFQ